MLHVAGITPEGDRPAAADADQFRIAYDDFVRAWQEFNSGSQHVDLVSLGSPHFSLEEMRKFAALMQGRALDENVSVIITLGRAVLEAARAEGLVFQLESAGMRILPDICWCSITEPLFPPTARVLMTNSGKYAHYAPGLCGREVRFGSLEDCADAAQSGRAPDDLPTWLK
jgi:predicted aconitase